MNTVDTGLDGVPVCTSDISLTTLEAHGNPILLYRGYSIFDLVKGLFEESIYLLLQGHLPTKGQLGAFIQEFNNSRALDARIIEHMKSYPDDVHMMDFLLTTLSYARMFDKDYRNPLWQSPKSEPDKLADLILTTGMRMGAKIPTIVASGCRIQSGRPVIPPDADLNYAANFLNMLSIEPDEEAVAALNTVLILYLEHTINCSTFAALVAESSGTDPYSPLLAGSVSLKGVFHGGANECTADMLEKIGKPENAAAYIHGKLKRKEIIPGFGHRLKHYKDSVESRVRIAEGIARPLAKKKGLDYLFEIYDIISRIMHKEKERTPNADLPICILLKIVGIPKTLNTPLFQASRHFGWVANNIRQRKASGPLYRPTQKYTGPGADKIKSYVPLEKR